MMINIYILNSLSSQYSSYKVDKFKVLEPLAAVFFISVISFDALHCIFYILPSSCLKCEDQN